MPKPTRYRVIKYKIAGRTVEIAGLARPGVQNRQTASDAIAYLNEHRVHTIISLEDPKENAKSRGIFLRYPHMQYIEKYAVADFQPPSIAAIEEIYKIARDNTLSGKNTAIHCTAGLGRTGVVLSALKLKELMLAMPSDELNEDLNGKGKHIQLGIYAERRSRDAKHPCTALVKKSIEMIRSQGGSYNEDYVENEDQVDRLCEYQAYLVKTILAQRAAFGQACQQGDIGAIRHQISQGASPTNDHFIAAYSSGNIAVMRALIEGGIVPTAEMCEVALQPDNSQARMFLEIAILASQLEAELEMVRSLPSHSDTNEMIAPMNTVLMAVKQYCSAWSNETMPSETQCHGVIEALNTAITAPSLVEHHGFIKKTPVLREIAAAVQIIMNALSFVFNKIYKLMTNDKKPVYEQGLKAILKQPETDIVIKIRALKDKMTALKQTSNSLPQPISETTQLKKGG